MENHSFEVIVVGAGLSGIIAAQRYLNAHPEAQLVVLEKDQDIGGVFSRRRLYDTFWTQWTVGLSEFSDMPMQPPPESGRRHDFYLAKFTAEYLEQYVDRQDKDGHTLREKIVCNMDVQSIKKVDGRWEVVCDDTKGLQKTFSADKLMVASGLTSIPRMPDLSGAENFGGPVIHSEAFGINEDEILKSDSLKHITILGGGKSSADMVYAAAKAGKEVSWVIRTTGAGAPFFSPGKGKGPYNSAFEAASTRMVASISPSIFNDKNWWTNFLQRTSTGNWLLKKFIAKVDGDIRSEANYRGRESEKGFEKLEYDAPFFWQNGPGGLLHHDDFWDTVAKSVYVYRDEIESVEKGLVHLKGGEMLQSDVILCGTGWTPSIQFFDQEYLVRLGLPHDPEADSPDTTQNWARLDAEADRIITTTYPLLAHPPAYPHKHINSTPYRLYQGMAPIHDDSILMLNHISTGNKFFAAETQAIWAVAYFDKKIKLPASDEMEKEIALWVAFSRRRYLSAGQLGNNIGFETITYSDTLLRQLGLSAHSNKGWWKNNFEPFWPRDLGRAWAEYLARTGEMEKAYLSPTISG